MGPVKILKSRIHDDGFYALETSDAPLLGQYLREAGMPRPDILRKLADFLDPPTKNAAKLVFVNKLGRPVKDGNKKANIPMMVRFARRRNGGKMEAAVAEVMKKTGLGRSTVFAALSAAKKPAKKSKSKKR